MDDFKESLCATCLYGAQPYGYYPFVCVAEEDIKEFYEDIYKCKFYEKAPEPPEPPKMTPWKVIKGRGTMKKCINCQRYYEMRIAGEGKSEWKKYCRQEEVYKPCSGDTCDYPHYFKKKEQ